MKAAPPKSVRVTGKAGKSADRNPPRKTDTAERNDPIKSQDVIDWLRERIRLGRLVPGQRLVEADIIKETAASRAKVREALQRLEAEGLVTIEEFRGASVKRFSHEEIRQIYRVRMALEGLAAAEFAAADAPKLKQKLKALQDQLNAGENTGDHERFAKLNDEWHRLIIEGSGNTYISTFLQRLRIPIYRLLFTSFYCGCQASNQAFVTALARSVLSKLCADAAEKLMRAHVAEGLAVISQFESSYFS